MNPSTIKKITTKVKCITPDKACRMLDKNTMNRNIDQKRVEQYARDMKSGRWTLNGSTIVIAKDGTILDGQHRLWGVIIAGVPVFFLIVYNAAKEDINTIDTGMARTSRHILQIANSKHSTTAATTTKLLWLHDNIDRDLSPETCRMNVSNFELSAFYNKRKDMIEKAASVAEHKHPFVKSHMALAFCIIGRSTAHRDKLAEFFETLKNVAPIGPRHPIATLQAKLFNNKLKNRKMSVQETLAAYIRVWNAFVRGNDLTTIRWNASEPIPEVL